MKKTLTAFCITAFTILAASAVRSEDKQWVVYEGKEGPGKGKHVVLVSGDDEYRSEETLPALGKILAVRHGFKCTVLFAIDEKNGEITPSHQTHIPGLEALDHADLMIIFTRFRSLPDDQMKHVVDYVNSGRPVIGMRTATHAFNVRGKSEYSSWSFNSRDWDGGFGRQVLGETWINHHGHHGRESTRGIIAEDAKDHPILRGVTDVWGPTDVYGVRLPLPGDSKPLVLGQVLAGMTPDSKPVEGKKNDPMMPVAWVKTYETPSGKKARVFSTTMGASQDFQSVGVRRLLVNASYWCLGLDEKITADSNVDLVGKFEPTPFGFGTFTKGVRPDDHDL